MNGKFAWTSVAVYRGCVFSSRSIIKCDPGENFGALMKRLEVQLGSETVAEVTISSDDKSMHSAHTFRCSNHLLEAYGCHYVNFYFATSSSTISQPQQPPNALEILMKNAEQLVLPAASMIHLLALSNTIVVITGFVMTLFTI